MKEHLLEEMLLGECGVSGSRCWNAMSQSEAQECLPETKRVRLAQGFSRGKRDHQGDSGDFIQWRTRQHEMIALPAPVLCPWLSKAGAKLEGLEPTNHGIKGLHLVRGADVMAVRRTARSFSRRVRTSGELSCAHRRESIALTTWITTGRGSSQQNPKPSP